MKKHGYTLIELIVVMATLSVIMGIAVVLLARLIGFQQNYSGYVEGTRAADRFVADFRSDVRTYGKPEILTDGGGTLLRWATETETIEYTTQPGKFPEELHVVRTVQKEGQQHHYETYRLPDRAALHFADGVGNNAGLIALSLWIAPQGTETPNLERLDPFDRTVRNSSEQQVAFKHPNPLKYASHWRTIIARY